MGKTGIVGVLHGSGKGTTAIGLRADMDALPMQEKNGFAHASKTPGRMHACGHDGHSTMLLGAAQYLAETRNFDGTVYFIFQPAEEGGNGGEAMIKDGLFERFDMNTVWGMHNWPGMDVGKIGVHNGACMAAADFFEIYITGSGGHAAIPDLTIDPIPCGAAIVQSLQSIVSRRITALEPAVVSVTIFDAGALNVIPGAARLNALSGHFHLKYVNCWKSQFVVSPSQQLRPSVAGWKLIGSRAIHQRLIMLMSRQGRYPSHQTFWERRISLLICRHQWGRKILPLCSGRNLVHIFGLVPGPAKEGAMLHNDRYDFNDDVLATGASYWARLVESELPKIKLAHHIRTICELR